MIGEPTITKAAVWQDSDAVLLARVRSIDGTYIQQANFSSIVATVYDQNNSMAVVATVTLTISSVVFDTLQAYDGVLWRADRTGYNFKVRMAGVTVFPEARDYAVVILFTLTDGTTFPLKYELSAEAVP